MPIEITSEKAIEQSTFIVTLHFKDENGEDTTPDSVKWSLITGEEDLVNSRSEVDIPEPQAIQDILLQGDDLAILRGRLEEYRWLIVEATYTSSRGSGLPLNEQIRFSVLNLKKVQ